VIVVECPLCRPLFRLGWVGNHAQIMGTVYAENGDPGGTLTSYAGGRVNRAGRVTATDPALAPGSSASLGRKTIRHVCAHRRKQSQTVTQAGYQCSIFAPTLCNNKGHNRIAPRSEALPKCRSPAVPSRTRH
jgi:hypothetical protein